MQKTFRWLSVGFVFLLFGFSPLSAQAQMLVSDMTFEDSNLTRCIMTELVLGQNTDEVTTIDCKEYGISDLEGLDEFTNLRVLRLYDNEITDISVLSNLSQLAILDLSKNTINSLAPLANLEHLSGLELNSCGINDLSALTNRKSLTALNIDNNNVVDLSPLSGLDKLEVLHAGANNINNISHLSSLDSITRLLIQFNAITDIEELKDRVTLTELNLEGNENILCSDLDELESALSSTIIQRPASCKGDVVVVNPNIKRVAVVLAEPSDEEFDSNFRNKLENEILPNLKDYWCEQSFGVRNSNEVCEGGLVDFDFTILDNNGASYKVNQTNKYYSANREYDFIDSTYKMITKSTEVLKNPDFVMFIHPGPSEQAFSDKDEYPNYIAAFTNFKKYPTPIVIVGETDNISILLHELGHAAIGLSDLYKDAQGIQNYSGDVPKWDLMGASKHRAVAISSFSKKWLGWLNEELIDYGKQQAIVALSTMKKGDKIKRYNLSDGSYVLFELRTKDPRFSRWDSENFPLGYFDVSMQDDALVVYQVKNNKGKAFVEIAKVIELKESHEFFANPSSNIFIKVTSKETKFLGGEAFIFVDVKKPYFSNSSTEKTTGITLQSDHNILSSIDKNNTSTTYSPSLTKETIDIDLHAITPDGLHVGMNYETGEYENQIPGAMTSGDLLYNTEWIFFPEGTEVEFYVSSHDMEEYFAANPEIAAQLDSLEESYSIQMISYDEEGTRVESPILENQTIAPGVEDSYTVSEDGELIKEDEEEKVKIKADIWVTPTKLNLKSKGKHIKGFIELPEGSDLSLIELKTVKLKANGEKVRADQGFSKIGDHNKNGIPDMMVRFDRAAVQDILDKGINKVKIRGKINGDLFRGRTKVEAHQKGKKCKKPKKEKEDKNSKKPKKEPKQEKANPGKKQVEKKTHGKKK